LQHSFFFDGNSKRIAWMIKNKNLEINQKREHADIYLDKITGQQSKYVALHVGLFWGIGRFIIQNEDQINVKIDNKQMFEHLREGKKISDDFINTRSGFIFQFIKQRKLKINYQLITPEENYISKLI
jgi:6-phosphofructokinase